MLNTDGSQNTANGALALLNNVGGAFNTGNGDGVLFNNTTGNSNTAIGSLAGTDITGSGNVCIGQNISGAAG